ncbi:hypothetical protein RCC89_01400 [Cytophagaceae bacterium ABcell3]|nr:hypothetical protein RCC89_01400 [Cytophagaceae bacterium ABcell3]
MRKLTLLFLSAIFALTFTANAQETTPGAAAPEEESPFSMDITLNSDAFFGFYPFFAGSYALSESSAFTFYGILWSGGTAGGWGNWTEVGVGYNFSPFDGLDINPQIGLLSGSLLSGLGTPHLGEGIVPNLTVGLDLDHIEGELYAGYYHGFDRNDIGTNNYLHWWLSSGYKFGNGFFSAGLHLEHLRYMGGVGEEGTASDLYLALGPYIQFADPTGGAFARFSTGLDLRSDEEVAASGVDQPSFWKLTVGYSF